MAGLHSYWLSGKLRGDGSEPGEPALLSLDQLTGISNNDFIYRSLGASYLAPARDIGGMVHGRFFGRDLTYAVGLFEHDGETGQTVLYGLGELHLEILVDRMKREFKVEANVGAPQVAYRETITKRSEIDYTHKKQSGGSGQFARVKMVFLPGDKGTGFKFDSKVIGGTVPKEYLPGVEKGLNSAVQNEIGRAHV